MTIKKSYRIDNVKGKKQQRGKKKKKTKEKKRERVKENIGLLQLREQTAFFSTL